MDRSLSDFSGEDGSESSDDAGRVDEVYTVSEVTERVKFLLEDDERLSDVRVEGEISNFTHHSSGHMYFSLKDDDTVLDCVMFERANRNLGFEPEEGTDVVAEGRVSVYEQRGEYQLYVDSMEKVGRGDLYRKYLELKEKLDDEGLFDPEHKKEPPDYPERVGVVTSDSGAALHDIRDVLSRRFPVDVVLSPAKVQGEEAAPEIARSLRRVDDEDVDVVIVGRGGGSIEDLWAFNEELVARAVFDCETPVVSGVGHEVDTTITDHVADVRAATPSEAAEVTVPNLNEELRRIEKLEERMRSSVERMVESRKRALESHEEVLRKRPPVIDEYFQRLDELHDSLERSARGVVDDARSGVEENARLLESLSPLSVLSRGYSVVESDEGVVESVEDVAPGEGISVRLEDGTVDATVDETRRDG